VWHVKRAWLKHLKKKVASWQTRGAIMAELDAILECRNLETAKQMTEEFRRKWVRLRIFLLASHRPPAYKARDVPRSPRMTRECGMLSVGITAQVYPRPVRRQSADSVCCAPRR
jgi:hypothetical protein